MQHHTMRRRRTFSKPTQTLLVLFSWLILLGMATCWNCLAAESAATLDDASRVLEFSGVVEIALRNQEVWKPATPLQTLTLGDRLRTGPQSKATLRLSDKSVIRIHELSVVEIQAPSASGQRKFKLHKGSLFFLNRENPGNIEFETPLATGAIRGTEFALTVSETDGTTQLEMVDGEVQLNASGEQRAMKAGQQARIVPGRPIEIAPALPLHRLIQWCFYYPGVLHPGDLPLTPEETRRLARSLEAYRLGDLKQAAENLAPPASGDTDAVRIYAAFVRLSLGQIETARAASASWPAESAFSIAMRTVVSAVTGDTTTNTPSSAPGTATEWMALSYAQQAESQVIAALQSARRATELAPESGFAWARVAELEFSLEHLSASKKALERARELAPRHPQLKVIEGFMALESQKASRALALFTEAITLDGALGSAWLGRALAQEQLGHPDEGHRDLQTAAALEPQRSLFRSYLGKAWAQAGLSKEADKDLAMARRLDPLDPTPWYYEALHRFQRRQINGAVRDLEKAAELNGNRSLFRSRLQLDRDAAIRSADLASVYQTAGLDEPGERAAETAIEKDPTSFSAHLFKARSLLDRESPFRASLRSETARYSEWLLANLLAPPGGGHLSQTLSQQDRLNYFNQPKLGFSSVTEYASRGDWLQAASLYGRLGGLSYAFDESYTSVHKERPNSGLERIGYSMQASQVLGQQDTVLLGVSSVRTDSGDISDLYDPALAKTTLRAREFQEPAVNAGWHRQWSPESHTLFLASRTPDRFLLHDPNPSPLFLRRSGGAIVSVTPDPFFTLDLQSHLELYSAELQQLYHTEHHSIIVGARFQSGDVQTDARLTRFPGTFSSLQQSDDTLRRANGYGYYQWHPVEPLRLNAGLSYDWVEFPANLDLPPVNASPVQRSRWSPKLGFSYDVWKGGSWKGAWTRSLGGVYFDNSIRLEPTQFSGFNQAYRSLIPESAGGLLAGADFDTWDLRFDQTFSRGLYTGVSGEILQSVGMRSVGAFQNSGFLPTPDTAVTTRQSLDFEERSVSAYAHQLIGDEWSVGGHYRLSHATLGTRFPDIPSTALNLDALSQTQSSLLGQLHLQLLFNHPSGVFGQWNSDWYHQSNAGYAVDRPGQRFWQHDVHLGYRFPNRRAELRVGVLNLLNQDYRLNPLNIHGDMARHRTLATTLRLNF